MMTNLQRDLRHGVVVQHDVRPRRFPVDTYAHAWIRGYWNTLPPAYHEWPGIFQQEGFGSCATGFVVEALPLRGHYDIPVRPLGFHRMSCDGFRCDYMSDPTRWLFAHNVPLADAPYPFNMLAGY